MSVTLKAERRRRARVLAPNPSVVFTVADVLTHLKLSSETLWVVLGEESFTPTQLDHIERQHAGRSLDTFINSVRGELIAIIREFFNVAARQDSNERFPLTAGVPLSVRQWRDVETLFGANHYIQTVQRSLVILVAKSSPAERLAGLILGRTEGYISPFPLVARFARTVFRRLVLRRPAGMVGRDLWISVGHFIVSKEADTFYARWPWQTGRSFLRVYMQGGNALRLIVSEEQLPLEALLYWADIWSALRTTWTAIRHIRSGCASNFQQRLIRILWLEEVFTGQVFTLAIQRLAWRRAINDLVPSRIIVPYEGRAWEIAMLQQASCAGVKTVGYQHSSLTARHLAVLKEDADPSENKRSVPDVIICCGNVTAQRIATAKPGLQSRIRHGAALRLAKTSIEPRGQAILVALSSSRQEALAMFRMFAAACKLGLSMTLIFRPHPTIPVIDLFDMFDWPDSVKFSRQRPLDEDLAEAWCVAYSSATVVLEGMRRARIPMFVDIGDVLSGDPLDEVASCKLKVATPAQLVSEVESLINDHVRCEAIGKAACDYAQRYLAEPTVERISEMTSWLEQA